MSGFVVRASRCDTTRADCGLSKHARRDTPHSQMSRFGVVVVGAGVNGLGTARRLAEEGLQVVVIERLGEIGGIWTQFANDTSRSQNHEPAYRLGKRPGAEDYTTKPNVIADLRRDAVAAGVSVRCGCEVVRVEDTPAEADVRLFFRRSSSEEEPQLLLCSEVIFCTGSLQHPRDPALVDERSFGGPVVLGVGSAVNAVELRGKVVAVIGMGAFAIENARLALLSGAAHVHMVARRRTHVTSRFLRVLNILSTDAFFRRRSDGGEDGVLLPSLGLDRDAMMDQQYSRCDAGDSRPEASDLSSTTPWTTSDIFFLAHKLGRLSVTKGTVGRLAPGRVIVTQGGSSSGGGYNSAVDPEAEELELSCDVVIKNLGFEGLDPGDQMGGVCEIVGRRTCRLLWITPRILCFRHQTDLPRLSRRDVRRLTATAMAAEAREAAAAVGASQQLQVGRQPPQPQLTEAAPQLQPEPEPEEQDDAQGIQWNAPAKQHNSSGEDWLGPNWVGSASHGNGVWTEIFLHYRRRPAALAKLLAVLPVTALSATTLATVSRGIQLALSGKSVSASEIYLSSYVSNFWPQ